jgi:hypothetical protein
MRKISILLVLTAFTSLVFAAKAAVLPELNKPEALLIDNSKTFITEGINVYIYSLKDFKLQKKFGKAGEGPQEFKKVTAPWLPSIYIYLKPGEIFINSRGKVSLFTREGTFMKEMNTASLARRFIPIGEKYIGLGFSQEDKTLYYTFNLHDSLFKKEKMVFRIKFPQQQGKKMNPIVMALIKNLSLKYAYKKKLFLPTGDGIVHVFDDHGQEVYTINPGYKKVKVTSELKKKYDDFFKTDVRFRQIYAVSSNQIEFPDYLPLMKDYRVSDDKVYIISNKQENKKYESFIFDLKGKLLKKTLLHLIDKDILEVYPFAIKNGKIYQLIENEDQEEWELHVTEIGEALPIPQK